MTSNVITVLAVVAGIVWLGVMLVSALRSRGGEEIAHNLRPGIDDQRLETRRLERGQKAAIAFSAFLAISLPLYFLGEPNRQEGFVEEFDEASVERGAHIVEEFACFGCHGPLGSGGVASYVEKRSGVTVDWVAPRLDDIFYRYDESEVTFWITFGRGNTPMPAWGLAGGGPMNEHQVQDVVNYVRTIQIDQATAASEAMRRVDNELSRLAGGDAAVAAAIVEQSQVVAEIDQAPEDSAFITPLAERAVEVQEGAERGIDTDADGLSDVAEVELSEISAAAVEYFRAVEPVMLDPATPDAEKVDQILAALEAGTERDPILVRYLTAIQAILDTAEEGDDADGDGISDGAEGQITAQVAEAANSTVPGGLVVVALDPINPESVSGVLDTRTANSLVGTLESVDINKRVLVDNENRIRPQEEAGLEFLIDAQEQRAWSIDIPGVAAAMDASEEEAQRAVGLFNANCARCHTAGFSAGIPYTQEAGSGGMGPALWDGRPVVQFGPPPEDPEEPDLLIEFLTMGSEAETPYGLNGFGTGRMPAFGPTLSMEDLQLLARYLRSGNLDGME